MQDLNDKITGNNLTADEWNQMPTEIQNIIEAIGQTLSGANLNQLGIALASYISNGNFYDDSGSANAYTLTKIGSKQAAFAYVDGMRIIFEPGNTNTGASTVNVDTLGAITITGLVGGELRAGERTVLEYRDSSGEFEIIVSTVAKQTVVPADTASAFHLSKNGADGGLYINEDDSISFSRDALYNGTQWIPKATAAQIFRLSTTEGLQMYSDSGLTIDLAYTPTLVWEVDSVGDLTTGTVPSTAISNPSFRAYLTGSQDNITGTQKIQFNNESFDTDGDYDPTTNYRYTPSVAGKYFLKAQITWSNLSAGDSIAIYIYKNGTEMVRTLKGTEDSFDLSIVSDVVEANGSGDYFEIFAQNTGRDTSDLIGRIASSDRTFFTGFKVGN